MNFGQILVQKKLLTAEQLTELEAGVIESAKTLEELILEKKLVPELDLFKQKSENLNVPLKEIIPDDVPFELLATIPQESVEFYKMVPLGVDKEKKIFEVGMVYPEDSQAHEALKFLARQNKYSLSICMITLSNFNKYLSKYQAPEREVESALEGLEKEMKGAEGSVKMGKEDLSRLVEDAPTIKMVAVMVRQAVEGGASDIHIEPTRTNSKIRFRLDGVLYPSLVLPLKIHPAIVARVKILSSLKIDETRFPQDGRFSTQIGEKRIDFRVSTFPTTLGEKVVIRILDPEKGFRTLESLGLDGKNHDLLEEAIRATFGMIIVSGPTGSGKSTTLYAVLRMLNNEGVNIVTLEDPVEYFMEGISQSQVKPEINYTFARGLRQILRQDPDIIMVGEVRDEETASLAVQAALTGHLVLTTLHTNNAPGVVPRLIDMGIKPFLIPASLNLAMSQRLVRVLCEGCKVKVEAAGESKRYLLERIKKMPPAVIEQLKIDLNGPIYVYSPKGCKQCRNKGYAGRIGIFEIIRMTSSLATLINHDPSEQGIFQQARAQGMSTMEEEAVIKVLKGVTALEEIVGMTEEK